MGWTVDQQKVIDVRDVDLLVSAAAGSGKTAVLVERIISRILDEANPMDIDEILVVTFTNAAAAEMKDRVRVAIEKALEENPSSDHLRRQATLVHGAQIRTIDSFCSYLVKNYFYKIGIDPGFRIGSKSELSIICDEVLDDLLSECLAPENQEFKVLSDAYVNRNKLDKLKGMIKGLAGHASSAPWPQDWFNSCLRAYNFSGEEEFLQSTLVSDINAYAKACFDEIVSLMKEAYNSYNLDFGSADGKIISTEYDLYCQFAELSDFREYQEKFASIPDNFFARWGKTKSPLLEADIAKNKAVRDQCKAIFVNLRDAFFLQSVEDVVRDAGFVRSQLQQLVSVTREYLRRVDELKKLNNTYDFNDVAHMALSILCDATSPLHERSEVAIELAGHFKEVMVDEYQDSNYLQEAILTAVCAHHEGRHDYFMVGDVKQSIYAFRQAKPSLFMGKFARFAREDLIDNRRIDLGVNFRSRKEVLEFCNDICSQLMDEDVGGVAYDEKAALVYGASATYDGLQSKDYAPEILIMEADKEALKELKIQSKVHLEAKMVADRINELVASKLQVFDKSAGVFRDVQYKDIVILMRGLSSRSDAYVQMLRSSGVPAVVESETGFFDREEVVNLLSLLSVIDNPYNDIPLCSALLCPIFNFNDSLLAQIRLKCPNRYLYGSLKAYFEMHPDCEPLREFFELLKELKNLAMDTPVHEILQWLIDRKGYLNYVKSLPSGEFRAANVQKLLDEAVKFETGLLVSLSDFVRYINDLKSYDEDPGLAKSTGANANAVRLMTIHKSKGLEFPVVFLCSAGSGFNKDKDTLLFQDKYGIGLEFVDPDRRLTHKTAISAQLKKSREIDQLGEEQRVLYVALTRAKEKIIVTGVMEPSKDSDVAAKVEALQSRTVPLSTFDKLSAGCYLDWILMALSKDKFKYQPKLLTVSDLLATEAKTQLTSEMKKEGLLLGLGSADGELTARISDMTGFKYESQSLGNNYKNKYSVSELKHMAMEEAYEEDERIEPAAFLLKEDEPYVPLFIRELEAGDGAVSSGTAADDASESDGEGADAGDGDAVSSGAEAGAGVVSHGHVPAGAIYGTAIHRFLECFDFERDDYSDSVREQLEAMLARGEIDREQYGFIKRSRMKKFVDSDLCRRMHLAAKEGKLYKEQPFVMGCRPDELFEEGQNCEELILVQGIIDVFFEEAGQLVILDYKTDKVDTESQLMIRYEKQLALYARAVGNSYSQPVKERLIYSFALGKTIVI